MLKPNFPTTVAFSLLALTSVGIRSAQGQAAANGAMSVYQAGVGLHTVSGEVSLPNGYSYGTLPAIVTPQLDGAGFIESLTINPGSIVTVPPSTADEAAANLLSDPALSLADVVSIIRGGTSFIDAPVSQARASGSASFFNDNGGYIQTVSGEVVLPAGFYYQGADFPAPDPNCVAGSGCLVISSSLGTIPNSSGNLSVERLLINPGAPIEPVAPYYNFVGAAATRLRDATTLEEQVSIIRAGLPLLNSTSLSSQASATGSSTLVAPEGFSQTVSGEIALANSLYYVGVSDPNCGVGTNGCLLISPFLDLVPGTTEAVRILDLTVDPGTPSNPFSYFPDFNAAAANVLTGLVDLADQVSVIRAGTSGGSPNSPKIQARASGSVTISTPNGSSQSVSGEVSLPPGLYFDFNANANCGSGSCLTILPDVQWNLGMGVLETDPEAPNTAFIQNLVIDPGFVTPANPLLVGPSELLPLDFNAAAAYVLYQAIDNGQPLANIVSLIRAGASSGTLTSPDAAQARASGAATLMLPNGATQSVSSDLAIAPGQYFQGSADAACTSGQACLVMFPAFNNLYDGDPLSDPNLTSIAAFTLDPGGPEVTLPLWTFDAAAAYAISQPTNTVADNVSLIRAATGAQGLE